MRQITQCFNATLASIYQEITQLKALTALVHAYLARHEAVPCEVSRFSHGTLVLAVKDSVWATKLRYELPALRDHLRTAGLHQLTTIRIHLSPAAHLPLKKKPQGPLLSEQAKHIISDSATHGTHAPLKAALKRLGSPQTSTKSPSG